MHTDVQQRRGLRRRLCHCPDSPMEPRSAGIWRSPGTGVSTRAVLAPSRFVVASVPPSSEFRLPFHDFSALGVALHRTRAGVAGAAMVSALTGW